VPGSALLSSPSSDARTSSAAGLAEASNPAWAVVGGVSGVSRGAWRAAGLHQFRDRAHSARIAAISPTRPASTSIQSLAVRAGFREWTAAAGAG
jgi:hypothetical protein